MPYLSKTYPNHYHCECGIFVHDENRTAHEMRHNFINATREENKKTIEYLLEKLSKITY